jgi:hypothetical protein
MKVHAYAFVFLDLEGRWGLGGIVCLGGCTELVGAEYIGLSDSLTETGVLGRLRSPIRLWTASSMLERDSDTELVGVGLREGVVCLGWLHLSSFQRVTLALAPRR